LRTALNFRRVKPKTFGAHLVSGYARARRRAAADRPKRWSRRPLAGL